MTDEQQSPVPAPKKPRKKRCMSVTPSDRHLNVARRVIRQEEPFISAAVAEGYSPSFAHRGLTQAMKKIPALRRAIQEEAKKYVRGRRVEFSPEEQEEFTRFNLINNVIKGKDAAVRSLELLGKDKRVNMFQPEVAVGIFQNSVPAEWKQKFSLASDAPPTIEAEAEEPKEEKAE